MSSLSRNSRRSAAPHCPHRPYSTVMPPGCVLVRAAATHPPHRTQPEPVDPCSTPPTVGSGIASRTTTAPADTRTRSPHITRQRAAEAPGRVAADSAERPAPSSVKGSVASQGAAAPRAVSRTRHRGLRFVQLSGPHAVSGHPSGQRRRDAGCRWLPWSRDGWPRTSTRSRCSLLRPPPTLRQLSTHHR